MSVESETVEGRDPVLGVDGFVESTLPWGFQLEHDPLLFAVLSVPLSVTETIEPVVVRVKQSPETLLDLSKAVKRRILLRACAKHMEVSSSDDITKHSQAAISELLALVDAVGEHESHGDAPTGIGKSVLLAQAVHLKLDTLAVRGDRIRLAFLVDLVFPGLEAEDEKYIVGEERDIDRNLKLLLGLEIRGLAISDECFYPDHIGEEGNLLYLIQELVFADRLVHPREEQFVPTAFEDCLETWLVTLCTFG